MAASRPMKPNSATPISRAGDRSAAHASDAAETRKLARTSAMAKAAERPAFLPNASPMISAATGATGSARRTMSRAISRPTGLSLTCPPCPPWPFRLVAPHCVVVAIPHTGEKTHESDDDQHDDEQRGGPEPAVEAVADRPENHRHHRELEPLRHRF